MAHALDIFPGCAVEFADGSFMRVEEVFRNASSGRYEISGEGFRRSRELDGIFPKKANEVVRVATFATRTESEVIRMVRLVKTNRPFPEARTAISVEDGGWLTCRWIYDVSDKGRKRYGVLRRLTEQEADEGYKLRDSCLRREWRTKEDETQTKNIKSFPLRRTNTDSSSGGGSASSASSSPSSSMTSSTLSLPKVQFPTFTAPPNLFSMRPTVPRKPEIRTFSNEKKRYSFADAFCGGGGASLGAHMAGFRIKWSFDKDMDARDVYMRNFPRVQFYHCEASDFIAMGDAEQVDVLHLSPPCQTFSPAHTIAGKNDDQNEASVLALSDCMKITRARFATLEETFGLMDEKHSGFFNTVLHMFTDLGWSVSYKVLNSIKYGLPQRRNRLIMIAASPGETLPPFPSPTHYDKVYIPGLKPPMTLSDALRTVSFVSDDHETRVFEHPRPPYDANVPFAYTIRAGGGEYDIHPSGLRAFTARELCAIQSFPADYMFAKTSNLTTKRKIVGNAVPPKLGCAVFGSIRRQMERVDREREERGRRTREVF